MSTAILPAQPNLSLTNDASVFDSISSAGDFIPRIQFYSNKAGVVTEGLIPEKHYGVPKTKSQIMDLGKEVVVVPVTWRPKAVKFAGDDILASYDHTSKLFATIKAESGIPDSGCMFGPEFLLYIEKLDNFYTFFMGSKSARMESGPLRENLGKTVILKSKICKSKNGKFIWQTPEILTSDLPVKLPAQARIDDICKKFSTVPSDTEAAAAETRER